MKKIIIFIIIAVSNVGWSQVSDGKPVNKLNSHLGNGDSMTNLAQPFNTESNGFHTADDQWKDRYSNSRLSG